MISAICCSTRYRIGSGPTPGHRRLVLTSAGVITAPSTGQTGLDGDDASLKHGAEGGSDLRPPAWSWCGTGLTGGPAGSGGRRCVHRSSAGGSAPPLCTPDTQTPPSAAGRTSNRAGRPLARTPSLLTSSWTRTAQTSSLTHETPGWTRLLLVLDLLWPWLCRRTRNSAASRSLTSELSC